MRIHPYDLAPVLPEDVVFRQSRWWALLGMAVWALLMTAAVFLWSGRLGISVAGLPIPPWFGWCAIVGTTLLMLPLLWKFLGAFSAANWVLRLYGQRILLKIGPAASGDPARVFVAEFQSKEVEWVRSFRQVTTTRGTEGNTTSATTWLEVKLRDGDLEELKTCIQKAGAPRQWRGVTSSVSIPVSLTGEGVLRVEWRSPHTVMAPSIGRALRVLEREVRIQPPESAHRDFTKADADKEVMEQQIREFVEQGETVKATNLARQCHGYSLTEARAYIAGLGEKTRAALPDDGAAKNNVLPP